MDAAILGRVKACVEIGLPDSRQCKPWWAEHAGQLTDLEVSVLGHLSSIARLSFRKMWAIAEHMVLRDAQMQKSGGVAGQVGFYDYGAEVMLELGRNLSSSRTMLHETQKILWTFTSVLYMYDRKTSCQEKISKK